MFHHDSFIGENDCSKEFAEKVMRKSFLFTLFLPFLQEYSSVTIREIYFKFRISLSQTWPPYQ